jgi:hypothetical protein
MKLLQSGVSALTLRPSPLQLARVFSTTAANSDTQDAKRSPLIYPTSNARHHDLDSFLLYAKRHGLNPSSTVYVGTRYEYTVRQSLKRLGFSLQHSGGASDGGIDLLGEWKLGVANINMRVLIQCKALAKRAGPNLVRELEGAFNGVPAGWQGHGLMAILASHKPATKGMREALAKSTKPLGCITCTPDGHVLQMLWNKRAEDEGLLGVGIGVKHVEDSPGEYAIQLLWNGAPILDFGE